MLSFGPQSLYNGIFEQTHLQIHLGVGRGRVVVVVAPAAVIGVGFLGKRSLGVAQVSTAGYG